MPLQKDEKQWHAIFYLTAFIYFVSNLIYIIFGKAETQAWSSPDVTQLGVESSKSRKVSRISSVYDPGMVMLVDSI